MKNRIEWIDIAKGILIILVVVGHNHADGMLDFTINSFHMASFFVLSGLTFRVEGSFFEVVGKLVNRLLLPYVGFSFLLIAYQYAIHVLTGSKFSLIHGLVSIIIPISGSKGTTVYHYWFLPCLFIAEISAFSILKIYHYSRLRALLLTLLIIVICYFQFKWTGIVSILSITPIAIIYLLIGHYARGTIIRIIESHRYLVCIVSLLSFVVIVWSNYVLGAKAVDMSSLTLGNPALYLLGGLLGSVFIISLSIIVDSNSFLSSIGRDSILYYGLHYELLGVFRKIVGGIIPTILTIAILNIGIGASHRTKWKGKDDKNDLGYSSRV